MAQLITSLPLGARVAFGHYQVGSEQDEPIIWTVINKTKYIDDNGIEHITSVTLWSTYILDILAFDSKESANENINIANYGNNRYAYANLRTWLNSSENVWFNKQHGADSSPILSSIITGKSYDTKAGFLNFFTPEERNIIISTAVKTAKNNVIYSGNELYDITYDKVFLLSADEINMEPHDFISSEGELMDYFNPDINTNYGNALYVTTPTRSLVNNHGISGLTLNTSVAFPYGLRTPNVNSANKYYSVTTSGILDFENYAARGNAVGLRPACNISPYVVVELDDRDGLYKVESYIGRLRDLDIGNRVIFGNHKIGYSTQNQVVFPLHWIIADKFHEGYPDNSITLVTKDVIDIRAFDAREPNNAVVNRRSQGNNRYVHSNIRQWLNSDAGKGSWYNATHIADIPPSADNISIDTTAYDDLEGFLYNFSDRERRALLNTKLIVSKNYASDGGGSDIFHDKIFLLSKTEVGLGSENNIAEGSVLKLFDNDPSKRINAADGTPGGILYHTGYFNLLNGHENEPDSSSGNVLSWLLRTPNPQSSYEVRRIDDTGDYSNISASNGGYGIKVGCNLPGDAIVKYSDTIDGVVEYTVEVNTPAIINVNNIGNNIKTGPFSLSYFIDDYTDNRVSVYLDNKILDEYAEMLIQPNVINTINISRDIFESLNTGSHTIRIVAYNLSKFYIHDDNLNNDIYTGKWMNTTLESKFEISFDKIDPVILTEVDVISGPLFKKTESGYAMLFPTTTAENVYLDLPNDVTVKDELFESELGSYPVYSTGKVRHGSEFTHHIIAMSQLIEENKMFFAWCKENTELDNVTIYISCMDNKTCEIVDDFEIEIPTYTNIEDIPYFSMWVVKSSDNIIKLYTVNKTSDDNIILNTYDIDLSGEYITYNIDGNETLSNINHVMYSENNKTYYRINLTDAVTGEITVYDSVSQDSFYIHGLPTKEYVGSDTYEDFMFHANFIINTRSNNIYIAYKNHIDKYIIGYDESIGNIYYELDDNSRLVITGDNINNEYNHSCCCVDETTNIIYFATSEYEKILSINGSTMDIISEINVDGPIMSIGTLYYRNNRFVYAVLPDKILIFNNDLKYLYSMYNNTTNIVGDTKFPIIVNVDKYMSNVFYTGITDGEIIKYIFKKIGHSPRITKINKQAIRKSEFDHYSDKLIYRCKIISGLITSNSTVDINIKDIDSFNIADTNGWYPLVEEYDGYACIYAESIDNDDDINIEIIIQNE